jgi:hypothetical protein
MGFGITGVESSDSATGLMISSTDSGYTGISHISVDITNELRTACPRIQGSILDLEKRNFSPS